MIVNAVKFQEATPSKEEYAKSLKSVNALISKLQPLLTSSTIDMSQLETLVQEVNKVINSNTYATLSNTGSELKSPQEVIKGLNNLKTAVQNNQQQQNTNPQNQQATSTDAQNANANANANGNDNANGNTATDGNQSQNVTTNVQAKTELSTKLSSVAKNLISKGFTKEELLSIISNVQ